MKNISYHFLHVHRIVEVEEPTPINETVTIDGQEVDGFSVTCALGGCDMTYAIDNTT